MAAQPTPPNLQQMVIEDINWMAGPNRQADVMKTQNLESIFGLMTYQRRALAAPFEETARQWKADAQLSRSACEKLGTVGDAVELVSKAAGFDGSWVQGGAVT